MSILQLVDSPLYISNYTRSTLCIETAQTLPPTQILKEQLEAKEHILGSGLKEGIQGYS